MGLPRHTTDAAWSAWLMPRLLPWGAPGVPVGAMVPTGYAAYVRVLHRLQDGRRWREIAASQGRVLHPLAQWSHFFDTVHHPNLRPPDGHLPRPDHDALLAHLPASGNVTYAVWEGYGFWGGGTVQAHHPGLTTYEIPVPSRVPGAAEPWLAGIAPTAGSTPIRTVVRSASVIAAPRSTVFRARTTSVVVDADTHKNALNKPPTNKAATEPNRNAGRRRTGTDATDAAARCGSSPPGPAGATGDATEDRLIAQLLVSHRLTTPAGGFWDTKHQQTSKRAHTNRPDAETPKRGSPPLHGVSRDVAATQLTSHGGDGDLRRSP